MQVEQGRRAQKVQTEQLLFLARLLVLAVAQVVRALHQTANLADRVVARQQVPAVHRVR